MRSIERHFLSIPVLMLSLAGCGLKGPLYLPDGGQDPVPASSERARPVLEGSRLRTLPPAPQSQKKDRERTRESAPSEDAQSDAPLPVSPADPDRPANTPPPPGQ